MKANLSRDFLPTGHGIVYKYVSHGGYVVGALWARNPSDEEVRATPRRCWRKYNTRTRAFLD